MQINCVKLAEYQTFCQFLIMFWQFNAPLQKSKSFGNLYAPGSSNSVPPTFKLAILHQTLRPFLSVFFFFL